MCNDATSELTDSLGAVFGAKKSSKKVTWQSKFEDMTGRKPEALGIKTEEEGRTFLIEQAGKRADEGTVLTGYQGPLGTVH